MTSRDDEVVEMYAEDDLGPTDHESLIAAAVAASDREVWPSPAAPLAVARRLYRGWTTDDGLNTLLSHRGTWMRWHRAHWAEMDAAEVRQHVYVQLGRVNCLRPVRKNGDIDHYEAIRWDPNKRKVSDVLEAMQAVGHLSADVDPPSWIAARSRLDTAAGQIISCTNGLLDLSTRTVHPHSPALFNAVSVPFDYDQGAPEPAAWLEFLGSVWPDDSDSVELLRQFLGYVLSGRTDYQKMLLLIGPTRSGKGTIARMLTELVGRGHVAGPTLASLGTNFGLSPLLGKPLAVISDARLGSTPPHTVVERLLSITGEDMLTVDRKFRDPWSGKLPTRFVVLSNELPRFQDSSGAIANRLLVLTMTASFLGKEDRTLDRRLRAELPGILNWCLDGLDQLHRAGKFTAPKSSTDSATLLMDIASPVSAFIRDRCTRTPTDTVETDALYTAWKAWCEDNGHRATAKSTFGRDLRAVVPEVKVTQPRAEDGRQRHYEGIGLKPSHWPHNAPAPVPPVPAHPEPNPAQDDAQANPQVNRGGTGGTGTSALQPLHAGDTRVSRPFCACGEPLIHPESLARGQCAECHLTAPDPEPQQEGLFA